MRRELRSGRVGLAVDDMESRNSPLGSMPATNIHYVAAVLDITAKGKFGYAQGRLSRPFWQLKNRICGMSPTMQSSDLTQRMKGTGKRRQRKKLELKSEMSARRQDLLSSKFRSVKSRNTIEPRAKLQCYL